MLQIITLLLLAIFTSSQAGIVPALPKYLEGPSSRTVLIGPDGSKIDAFLPGGKILLENDNQGPVLQGAPIVYEKQSVQLHGIPVHVIHEEGMVLQETKTEKTAEIANEKVSVEESTEDLSASSIEAVTSSEVSAISEEATTEGMELTTHPEENTRTDNILQIGINSEVSENHKYHHFVRNDDEFAAPINGHFDHSFQGHYDHP